MILLELRREGGRQKTFEIFLDTLKHNLFLIPEIAVSTMDQVYGNLVFPLGVCQHECLEALVINTVIIVDGVTAEDSCHMNTQEAFWQVSGDACQSENALACVNDTKESQDGTA